MPQFDPEIKGPDHDAKYDDGFVLASVRRGRGMIVIDEFSSLVGGQGNARRALEWMKSECGVVEVLDPGHPETSPEALSFWTHMAEQGVVSTMYDADHNPIFAEGHWLDEEYAPAATRSATRTPDAI